MTFETSTQAAQPESTMSVALVNVSEWVSVPNLILALAAILFWSAVIGTVCFCYELRRFNHCWRWGIA